MSFGKAGKASHPAMFRVGRGATALVRSGVDDQGGIHFADAFLVVIPAVLGVAQEQARAGRAPPRVALVVGVERGRDRRLGRPGAGAARVVLLHRRVVHLRITQGADALQHGGIESTGHGLPALALQAAARGAAIAAVALAREPAQVRRAEQRDRVHSASSRMTRIRSLLPSKPMPGNSGSTTWPPSTFTPSGKPPKGWNRSG